ncbi:preimplantation protein 3 [Lobosporangium transversale]|uniref:Preimplantation protein 3 n=1 Tax=Lobosporangium transversale TaxID=64571 RepID=A0A1Y2GAX0_9FUNG|nr:preimplantation protein 3 [Lobosporangium transversale]ORZ05896.1 preimplantation protein 3 [Lobosporangium transversale]|eukprot:XP_021877277.1 preimplantation protein 3 [Lobosporangium transversale]
MMLTETPEQEASKHAKNSSVHQDSSKANDSNHSTAADNHVPTAGAHPLRNLPGTKDEKLYQWPQRSLESIESAFALREYLQALIRQDPHNLDLLIALPAGQDEHSWLYEHLCQICLELNYLIVHLEPECTPEACPEMRAEEWKYFCATHPTPRECCAIDYLTHTLDGASALLNNVKVFPSRICVPEGSVKNFQNIARRLYRIFAHAYFHHRDIFDAFEAETSLYERFLRLSRTRQLITEKLIIIPGQSNEDDTTHASTKQIMARSRDE